MKFSPSAAAAVVSLATAVSAKSSCKPKIDSELIQADIKTEKYVPSQSVVPSWRSQC
jgi:hypothetical protein